MFLSNDDVFLELFNDVERSRRYVTPEELRLLVERYLAVCGSRVTLDLVGGRRDVFHLSGEISKFGALLTRRLAQTGGGAKAARAFLARLPDEGCDVTFDPAIATVERRLEFISLHHPIVRALAMNDDPPERAVLLRGSQARPWPGLWGAGWLLHLRDASPWDEG